ncbi:hypothetical protein SKAU_G00056190 [Synaphobranchus kaupii]|uniref:Uncharacterized protein n=1 Tax=Synaphobranchus kaupii TaxID=118154 RepID=A0A9Q1G514_SYNKA|nr:hypothetical protein SKAU_G00056190 [Synaphobranchus kaupii]
MKSELEWVFHKAVKGFPAQIFTICFVASESELNFQAWRLCQPSATAWFCFERDKISSYLTRCSPVEEPHKGASPGQRVSHHFQVPSF